MRASSHIAPHSIRLTAVLCALLAAAALAATGPARETTTRSAPAALHLDRVNAWCSRGVTADNNAAVLLLSVLGPGCLRESIRPQTCRVLGLSPTGSGEYQPLRDFVKSVFTDDQSSERYKAVDKLRDRRSEATKGPWTAKDHPVIARWLKRNDTALDKLAAASRRSRYYIPLIPTGQTAEWTLPPLIGPMRQVTQALVARAMLRLGGGRIDDGLADLMAVHRLARLAAQGPGIVHQILGIRYDHVATDGDVAAASGRRLSAAQAKAHLDGLRRLVAFPTQRRLWQTTEIWMSDQFAVDLAASGFRKVYGGIAQMMLKIPAKDLPDCPLDAAELTRLYQLEARRTIRALAHLNWARRQAALGKLGDESVRIAGKSRAERRAFLARLAELARNDAVSNRLEITRGVYHFMATGNLLGLDPPAIEVGTGSQYPGGNSHGPGGVSGDPGRIPADAGEADAEMAPGRSGRSVHRQDDGLPKSRQGRARL